MSRVRGSSGTSRQSVQEDDDQIYLQRGGNTWSNDIRPNRSLIEHANDDRDKRPTIGTAIGRLSTIDSGRCPPAYCRLPEGVVNGRDRLLLASRARHTT